MSYNPVNWANGEEGGTPMSASNLNRMDKGIAEAHEILADHDKKIDDFVKEQIPEEYLQSSVDNYIANNQAGIATKTDVNNLDSKLSSEIGNVINMLDIYTDLNLTSLLKFNNGGFIAYNTGAFVPLDTYSYTDKILVIPNRVYEIRNVHDTQVCFYDVNGNYVSGTLDMRFTIPNNCHYITISVDTSLLSSIGLVLERLELPITTHKNILLDAKWLDGYFYAYNTGQIVSHPSFSCSNMIPCKESTIYEINSNAYQVCYFDKNKKFIIGSLEKNLFTTPSNCYYLILSIPIVEKENICVSAFERKTIYVGVGCEFTKLKDGIEYAVKYPNSTVYVGSGVYDLIEEFGNDYFENLGDGSSGLMLRNNIHVIFSSGAKVMCHYLGNNENVKIWFSPFNSLAEYIGNGDLQQGFILENLNLECSNVRYAFHDEHGDSDTPYRNEFVNCRMKIDNTNNTNHQTPIALGGGLGLHGEIIVDSCTFEGLPKQTEKTVVAFYHNNSSANSVGSLSNVVVKNSYFKGENATFKAGYIGNSQEITPCILSANSFGAKPFVEAEESTSQYVNMEIIEISNTIRQ